MCMFDVVLNADLSFLSFMDQLQRVQTAALEEMTGVAVSCSRYSVPLFECDESYKNHIRVRRGFKRSALKRKISHYV